MGMITLLWIGLFACRSAKTEPDPASVEQVQGPGDPSKGPEGEEPSVASIPALPRGVQRHAVVVVIDTLRHDALQRARTPVIDALEAGGAQRTWAWAPSTWTAPSIVSLFSGMPVRQHGWDFPFPVRMEMADKSYAPLPSTPLLAEVMREAGFRTTGLYANRMLGQGLGYDRGFDRWELDSDEALVQKAIEEIGRWQPGERHFLYLHLMGPHQPLQPGVRSLANWGLTKKDLGKKGKMSIPDSFSGDSIETSVYYRAYHAAIEDTDEQLGHVMRALRPLLEQTVLVITSDHGELLGEHGKMGHTRGLQEPLTRVPFLAWNAPQLPVLVPGEILPAVVTAATGLDHVWPTGLRTAGPLASQREGDLALTPDGRWKAVWDRRQPVDGLAFDLESDPGEHQPTTPLPVELAGLRASWEASVPAGSVEMQEGGMSEEMLQALEELGYLDH